LAYIGSIRDEVLDISELALDFIAKIRERYPKALIDRYNITLEGEPVEVLERICNSRKFIMRGGEIDWERGSRALLDDFRKGRLGRMTLDKIEDYKATKLR